MGHGGIGVVRALGALLLDQGGGGGLRGCLWERRGVCGGGGLGRKGVGQLEG